MNGPRFTSVGFTLFEVFSIIVFFSIRKICSCVSDLLLVMTFFVEIRSAGFLM